MRVLYMRFVLFLIVRVCVVVALGGFRVCSVLMPFGVVMLFNCVLSLFDVLRMLAFKCFHVFALCVVGVFVCFRVWLFRFFSRSNNSLQTKQS